MRKLEDAAIRWMVDNGALSAETFRWLRKKANLTQAELAELLGVSQETISRYETGETKCPIPEWSAVAHFALDFVEGHRTHVKRFEALRKDHSYASAEIDFGKLT